MPASQQKTVTIHRTTWGLAEAIYRENPERWALHNVRSPTGLIEHWLLEKIREHRAAG